MADKSNRDSNAPADEFAEGVKSIVVSRVGNRAGSSSPPTTPLQYKLHQVCQQVCKSKPSTPSGNRSKSRMGAVETPRRSGPGSCSTSSESSAGYVTPKDKGKGPLTASSININSVPNGVSAGHPFPDIIVALDNPLRVVGRKGGQEVILNSPGPSTTVGRGRSAAANGVLCKAPKPKRIRPSKKPYTQIINVSKEEFRPVVQAITGCRQLPEAQLVSRQPERSQTERQQVERPQAERPQPERRQAEHLEPVEPKLELQQPSEHKQAERQEPERPKANSVPVSVGTVANPPARPDSLTSRIQAVPSPSAIISSRVPEPTDLFDSCGSASSSSLYQYTLCESNDSIYKAFGFPEGHRGILDDDLEQASDDGHYQKPVREDGAGTSTPTAELSFKALSVVDDIDKKEDIQREHRLSGSAMAMPDSFPRLMLPRDFNDVHDDYEMDIFDEALICYDGYKSSNPVYGFF